MFHILRTVIVHLTLSIGGHAQRSERPKAVLYILAWHLPWTSPLDCVRTTDQFSDVVVIVIVVDIRRAYYS